MEIKRDIGRKKMKKKNATFHFRVTYFFTSILIPPHFFIFHVRAFPARNFKNVANPSIRSRNNFFRQSRNNAGSPREGCRATLPCLGGNNGANGTRIIVFTLARRGREDGVSFSPTARNNRNYAPTIYNSTAAGPSPHPRYRAAGCPVRCTVKCYYFSRCR